MTKQNVVRMPGGETVVGKSGVAPEMTINLPHFGPVAGRRATILTIVQDVWGEALLVQVQRGADGSMQAVYSALDAGVCGHMAEQLLALRDDLLATGGVQ